jgi:hypothetical protein
MPKGYLNTRSDKTPNGPRSPQALRRPCQTGINAAHHIAVRTGQSMIRHRASHRGIRLWAASALLLGGAACTQVPELDATIPDDLRNAPYPKLIRLDQSLFAVQPPQEQSAEIEKSLAARRDRLQSRARGLNSTVVDPAARKRMQDGVSR